MTKPLLAILLLLPSVAQGDCDVAYYCLTTALIDVKPDGEVVEHENIAFRFALKGDELLVPEGWSAVGEGTRSWDIRPPGCDSNGNPFFNDFSATTDNGFRSLWFTEGSVRAVYTNNPRKTRVLVAKCAAF